MAHEFDGHAYTEASAHQRQWGIRLIDELDLNGTERVLDLGCGDGVTTVRLAQRLPDGHVLGIDASRCMIETAKDNQRHNLDFILMDINHLAFSDGFDVIVSNAALHWVHHHERLLLDVFNVLKPGGRIRFNFAGYGNCRAFFKVIRSVMQNPAFAPHFRDFTWPWYMPSLAAYRKLVAASPLQQAKVWAENADHYFPDVTALIRWIDQPSLVPFVACVAAEDRAAFRTRVVEQMVRETRQGDGRCFETFRRINLAAVK